MLVTLSSLLAASGAWADDDRTPKKDVGEGVRVGGFLQPQYESHQDSEDQLRQDGALLNRNRFVLRRARLQLTREWEASEAFAEIDANTVNGGSNAGLRRAEASIFYRRKPGQMPLAKLTFGIFNVPFGYELGEPSRIRPFMERSVVSNALFPSEPDLGGMLSGGLGAFRWAVAVVNGEPARDRYAYSQRDPNSGKDVAVRFAVDETVGRLSFLGGVSYLRGRGFHAGTTATKDQLQWRDVNEDGQVQPTEIQAVPGAAATPSQSFWRWGVGADLRVTAKTPIGTTLLFGEIVWAQNLDRGLYTADPIATSLDVREKGWVIGVTHTLPAGAILGYRYDTYDPNADTQRKELGKLLPASASITTHSVVSGLSVSTHARLLFQVDFVKDHLARTPLGVPTDLRNNGSTLRLQVDL